MRCTHLAPVCLMLLLAACGKPSTETELPALQGTAPASEPTAATDPADATFALSDAGARTIDGELAIVLRFSQRLAGTQDFPRLVHLTDVHGGAVGGGWVLADDGRELRFTPVVANREYHVRIDRGLTAAAGAELPAAVARQVHSGPLEPAVSFASRGSVLPARGTRGLPVLAVNTPQVDVEFFRVREHQLADFFAAYTHNGLRDSWDLDPRWGWHGRNGQPLARIADSVYSQRFTLDCPANERCVNHLPIQDISELAPAGAYFAVMRAAGNLRDSYATSVFFVSDVGLHVRAYKDRILVHAASLATGTPLGGVRLRVQDRGGAERVHGQTDAQGNALLAYALDSADVLLGTLGGDVSFLPFNAPALDLSAFAVAGRPQAAFDVFAWSGRDLYRPGETLQLTALLRDHDGHELPAQPLFLTLRQPDGRAFVSSRLESGDLGAYRYTQDIPADAPTGTWQVEFRLDPASDSAVESMRFHVEEFLPERLKLELDSTAAHIDAGAALPLRVQADYLYGAPAAGNRFTARLSLTPEHHPVASLPDFWFGDAWVEISSESREVSDEKLDAEGHLAADITLFDAAPPATPVAAIISGSVFETGGRAVSRTLRRTVWPASALVGVHPLFDPEAGATANAVAGFELARVDAAGQLLAGSDLAVTLQREDRRYHWSWDDARGWTSDWVSEFRTLETRTVAIAAGETLALELPLDTGAYRLEVADPATGQVLRYPFFAGWNWKDENRGNEARPDRVKLALDQASYHAGDMLRVTVTPPHPGPGVLLVEADSLLHMQPLDASAEATYEIPVTEAWMRHDVYVTALVFRGGKARAETTPSRAVGVAHVPIARTARKLALAVEAPERMRPDEDLEVTVSAPALAGEDARVTVSAVDVGVLNITRFALPDPFGWFFGQRALGIDARDLYGRVIEALAGGTARLAWGGDMALEALPQAARPTAEQQIVDLFSDVVAFDADGRAHVSLPMPEFNGRVRVSAVAWSRDSYGAAERETLVRAPIVLQASTPRVLAPGDLSTLSVDATNFTGAEAQITLDVEAAPGLRVRGGSRSVHLAAGARTTVSWPLEAQEHFGSARIEVRARSGDVAVRTSRELVIRPAWPAETRSRTIVLDAPAAQAFPAELAAGLLPESLRGRMSLTALPPLPWANAFTGLQEYAYRCLEQTVSVGYGALLLTPELAAALHLDAPTPDARRRDVEAELGRLASLQLPNGHFSMWGGPQGQAATFLTPWVAEFMLNARAAGFAVNDQVLQRALERLKDDFLGGGNRYYGHEHADYLRFADLAHSAYVLARVERAPLGSLRTLFDREVAELARATRGAEATSALLRAKPLGALPLVHLGLALDLMGDAPRGRQALETAFRLDFERPRWLGDYGSDLRDRALMVALTHRHERARPDWDASLIDLTRNEASRDHDAARHQRERWYTTQERAALTRLAAALIGGRDEARIEGRWSVGGAARDIESDIFWSRLFDAAELGRGVRLEAAGQPPLFIIADASGVPRSAPAVDDAMIRVRRDWYTLDGKPWSGKEPLAEGAALIARLRIEARENAPDAMVTELLPGGLEVENLNLADSSQWVDLVIDGIRLDERVRAAALVHEEFRDDRYVAVLDLDSGAEAQLFYLVRAVTPGRYVVPPPRVADMYRPELRGTGASTPAHIEIIPP